MKVLCQSDLKASLASPPPAGQLQILNGDASHAKIVSYNPVLDKATSLLRGDLPTSETLVIHPNESIAVRTKERFHVPSDHFGICVNRVLNAHNQLSIDSTFIDPGYEGQLHFVIRNCGLSDVPIPTAFPIAKVVFFKIENNGVAKAAQDRHDIAHILAHVDMREKNRREEVKRRRKMQKRRFFGLFFIATFAIFLIQLGLKYWKGVEGDILTSSATLLAAFAAVYVVHFWNNDASEA